MVHSDLRSTRQDDFTVGVSSSPLENSLAPIVLQLSSFHYMSKVEPQNLTAEKPPVVVST